MKEIEIKEEIKEEIKQEFIPKPAQIRFSNLYLDISKRMTQEDIAKEIGITRKTIWNWLQNPAFVKWLNSQKDRLLETALIYIYKTAIRKAVGGHFNFAKLLLEMAGAYQPGLKIEAGETELIRIEVVQSQAQKQESQEIKKEVKNENN